MWHCSLRQHPSGRYMWSASSRKGPGSWHCVWKWFLLTYSAGQCPPETYVSMSHHICGMLSVHVNRCILQTSTSDTRTWCSVSQVIDSYEHTCPSNLQVSPGVLQIHVFNFEAMLSHERTIIAMKSLVQLSLLQMFSTTRPVRCITQTNWHHQTICNTIHMKSRFRKSYLTRRNCQRTSFVPLEYHYRTTISKTSRKQRACTYLWSTTIVPPFSFWT